MLANQIRRMILQPNVAIPEMAKDPKYSKSLKPGIILLAVLTLGLGLFGLAMAWLAALTAMGPRLPEWAGGLISGLFVQSPIAMLLQAARYLLLAARAACPLPCLSNSL